MRNKNVLHWWKALASTSLQKHQQVGSGNAKEAGEGLGSLSSHLILISSSLSAWGTPCNRVMYYTAQAGCMKGPRGGEDLRAQGMPSGFSHCDTPVWLL